MTALYDYSAQGEEEIDMEAGKILEVLECHEDGWWYGYVQGKEGKRGLFPSNFTDKGSAFGLNL